MPGSLGSTIIRYAAAAAVFAALIALPWALRAAFGFSFDTTFLIILAMVGCAWYLGMGPGLLIAFAFEGALIYFSTTPYTGRSAVITINRLLLFVSVVVFASLRRKSENRLRQQSELLRVTLSSIGDAVIATDLKGCVTFLNPTAEKLTGWSSDEAKKQHLNEVFKIIGETSRQPVASPLEEIRAKGTTVGLANHTLLIRKDGIEVPIDDSGAPIRNPDGELIGAVIVFRDVSDRRRTERERETLLQSESSARAEAETANRLKDEFLATVSHELRTPLNAIIGWSALMRENGEDPEFRDKGIDIIERNAKTQNELINEILDVSRIMTGKLRIKSEPVDLRAVAREAVETLHPAAAAKAIMVEHSLGDEAVYVRGDRDRLLQVLWNLLSNSVKFTGTGGRIKVKLTSAGGEVFLTVEDDGAGISPEFLPHVFDTFRQTDSSMRRAHGGLGLGLSTLR